MSEVGRYCSLIPGLGVKLSTTILAGPTVLSAVGAVWSTKGHRAGIPADDKAFCNAVSLKQSVGRGSRGCGQTAQQPIYGHTPYREKRAQLDLRGRKIFRA